MQYDKLQLGCLLIVLYVAFIYVRERYAYKIKKKEPVFAWLLLMGILEITLDGITAYTVNHLDSVPAVVNMVLHMCFLCSLDIMMFLMFLYLLDITRGIPKNRKKRILLMAPLVINLAIVIIFMPQLSYLHGNITNYSMGISAYTCFIMVAVYILAAIVILFTSWHQLGHHKLITVSTYVFASIVVTCYQMFHPQALISCIVPTPVIVGTYLNMENPVFTKLQDYSNEMVMGFATLVENRDDNTGGHIKRTTAYVRMLAEELRTRGLYKKQLTGDYIKNLVMAAPMHDVGKIAIPDAILQKPGKLTSEEFDIMKSIGMTDKQMKLMLFGEGSYYFMCVMGMLFTVGMAALVGVKIYMENKLSYFTFRWPILIIAGIMLSLLVVNVLVTHFVVGFCGEEKDSH